MSAIIGIDKPDSCGYCELSVYEKNAEHKCTCIPRYRKVTMDADPPKDCPLKSIDGLIKKIVNSPSDVGQKMYKTKYDGAARRQNEIIEIIKGYCEVEE